MIEVAFLADWRLLVAMLLLRSVSMSPASIREGPTANVGHPFRTLIDSPSSAQLSGGPRKCMFRQKGYGYGTAPASIQAVAVANLLALSASANIVMKASAEDCTGWGLPLAM